jgi:transcriptional/translational regulatory protein YebC/TACO1
VAKDKIQEDSLLEMALEAGADDVVVSDHGFEVRCNVHVFDKVAQALEQKGIKPDNAEIAYIPTTTIPVTDKNVAVAIEKLHDALEENDDVQMVYSNEEIDDTAARK